MTGRAHGHEPGPARPARHGGPVRRARTRLLRPRFRLVALVPVVALALGGGLAAGLGVDRMQAAAAEHRAVAQRAAEARDAASRSAVRAAVPRTGQVPSVTPTSTPTALPSPVPEPSSSPTPVRSAEDVLAGLLSHDTPAQASGTLVVVPGSEPAPLAGVKVRTVRVEVEDGLPVDAAAFAAFVMTTLNDPRGWGHGETMTFARTDGDDPDLRVVLASPLQVDAMCAPLQTNGEYSCGRYGHAAINFTRWVAATPEFADLTQYRQYVVNHEVGHLLGHPHEKCPGAGELAPIMQQQTIAVAPCVPNGWPYP